jgi:prepilin-type N-terminal cleavage/methylation domain-containing protein
MKKAFTLLELLIVVIVIGILAAIAVPQFLNSVEKARVGKAKNALGLLAHAEKMYHAEMDKYVNITTNCASGAANIALGNYVELSQVDCDTDWDYAVASSSALVYTITATKKTGTSHGAETIIIDQNGTCTGTHTLSGPDCGH